MEIMARDSCAAQNSEVAGSGIDQIGAAKPHFGEPGDFRILEHE
jgi:hypothetical protein